MKLLTKVSTAEKEKKKKRKRFFLQTFLDLIRKPLFKQHWALTKFDFTLVFWLKTRQVSNRSNNEGFTEEILVNENFLK